MAARFEMVQQAHEKTTGSEFRTSKTSETTTSLHAAGDAIVWWKRWGGHDRRLHEIATAVLTATPASVERMNSIDRLRVSLKQVRAGACAEASVLLRESEAADTALATPDPVVFGGAVVEATGRDQDRPVEEDRTSSRSLVEEDGDVV